MFDDSYARLGRLLSLAAVPLTIGLVPTPALADCVNPTAPEGRLVYNATHKIAQVCDGTNWISLGGSGSGGGISTAGNDTEIIFNDGGILSGNPSFVFDKTNIRLGIGTATPSESVDVTGVVTADGLTLKSVAADPPLSSSLGLGDLADVDTSGAADGLILKYNGGTSTWEAASDATGGGGSSLWTAAGSDIYYDSGNVGIGTTNPTYKLDVNGTVRIGPYSELGSTRLYVSDDALGRAISILSYDGNGAGVIGTTGEAGADNGFVLNAYRGGGKISFQVNGTERMRVTNVGNVGIGTTSPASALHVVGAENDGTNAALRVQSGTQIMILDGNEIDTIGSTNTLSVQGNNAGNVTLVNGGGKVGVGTTNPTEKLTVSGNLSVADISSTQAQFDIINSSGNGIAINGSNGNVDIGGTAAPNKLTVTGPGDITAANTGGGLLLQDNAGTASGWKLRLDVNEMQSANNGNAASFTINPFGGNVAIGSASGSSANLTFVGSSTTCAIGNGTGNTSCTSDRRLKDNVQPLDGALVKIGALKGVTFVWKKEPGIRRIGLIAQNVERVFPEVVETDAETGMKSVAYASLVAPLVEAVKELKADNDTLRSEHDAALRALRAELDALKSSLGR
ncbi:tail fiber domain-containing protein [Stappia indica]|uniref:tail fiber domain-containing protein n=1 Tax=Stappia indica TaxID=538381 RepID=UPI0009F367DC|nr:tail fiber domain-containing protein [Stappia indica]